MKRLLIVFMLILSGCTVKTDVITKSTINYINVDKEQRSIDPIDVVTVNDIDYVSVSDLRMVLSNRSINDNFKYTELFEIKTDDELVIYNEENGLSLTFSNDGTVKYVYNSTIESEFLGFVSSGNILDIYSKELGMVMVLTQITYQEKEFVKETYEKTIDLNSFGVKPLYEEEIYIPVHLMSFLFNGFSHLNFTLIDDELLFYDYVEGVDKSYGDNMELNDDVKNYFIEFYKFMYYEYYFSEELYSGSYNEYSEEVFKNMYRAKHFDDFYSRFNELLYNLNDYHVYMKKYGQTYQTFNSNYGDLVNRHKEEGNLPKYNSVNDFRHELKGDTLVLTLDTFLDDYSSDIENLIKEHNPSDIILDLRNNSGGDVTNLYNTLSLFSSSFLFNAIDYNDNKISLMHRFYDSFFFGGELYVLTSELTFSTATWFSSIVKSNEIGLLVGETTAGGHTATIPIVLPDGSVINMAVAIAALVDENFDWIEKGITPDVAVKDEYINGEDMILKTALDMINDKY
ncbi:S41 family peptidase [Mycoplasmatota bacterium WC44]